MHKATYFALALALTSASLDGSSAADICKALALRDVPAYPRGATVEAVTQYVVEKQTGKTSFCQHGGGCYPSEALRLINCTVGELNSDDGYELIYYLDVDRSKNSKEDLRIDDVDNRLLEMGLCSACAGNVAMFYVKRPNSPCALLAKGALEGNPLAVDKLLKDPAYCQWR